MLASLYTYQAPILLGGVGLILLHLYLVFAMPETNFAPSPRQERNTFRQMVATLSEGINVVRTSAILVLLMSTELIAGAAAEGFDRLVEAHYLQNLNMPVLTVPVLGELDLIAWFAIWNIAAVALGAALGRLHTLPLPTEKPLRRAGMLPSRELAWVASQLAAVEARVPGQLRAEYEHLVAAVQNTDHCENLPITLIHNDCNLGNVVLTPSGQVALVDWESAGLGPAVIDVGILLRNCYVEEQGRIHDEAITAIVDGYCQHRRLTQAELARLPDAIRFMTLVLLAAYFPDRMDGALHDDDLIYGATYAAWQAEYAATDQIAQLARNRFAQQNRSVMTI